MQQHSRARERDKRCHVGRGAECVDSGDAAPGRSVLFHSTNNECMSTEQTTSKKPMPAKQRAVSAGVKTAINQARLGRVES